MLVYVHPYQAMSFERATTWTIGVSSWRIAVRKKCDEVTVAARARDVVTSKSPCRETAANPTEDFVQEIHHVIESV